MVGRAWGVCGGQATHLASISTILTSRTVESEVPSGHAVLGAQQKLSAQQPAPREAILVCAQHAADET